MDPLRGMASLAAEEAAQVLNAAAMEEREITLLAMVKMAVKEPEAADRDGALIIEVMQIKLVTVVMVLLSSSGK